MLYNKQNEHNVLFVPVLQGAIPFFHDICQHLSFDPYIEYIGVKSYEGIAQKDHIIYKTVNKDLIENREVWLFDDIADSGNTFKFLTNMFLYMGAKSVNTCVLLKKRKCPFPVTLHAFEMDDEWVWGYGMDGPNGRGRSLPMVVYQ